MNVVTRIPPSPTGHLHIGTVRTALFNYLYARKHGGTFVFRSEDTDRARSTKAFEEEIIEGLAWLGLIHDGDIVRQSERVERYTELLQKIVSEGKAYVSQEESKQYPGQTVSVVRLKNPGKDVTFRDLVRGDITFNTEELGDFVIARAIDDPLYHFAVVVDDFDMGVTHVIRGDDHISNTPRQILIQEAVGAPRPLYAHLPLILAPDRSKLSKRHGAVSLLEYREEGFLPEALINYLALLGWSAGDDREHYSLAELIEAFDLSGVHKGGAVWDREKLLSVNQRWMRTLSDDEYVARGALIAPDKDILMKAVPLMKERAKTFKEAREMLSGELNSLFEVPLVTKEALTAKQPKDMDGLTKSALEGTLKLVEALPEGLSSESVQETLMPFAEQNPKEKGGRGAVLWPLRYALSGLERSPDPFSLISILGPKESAARIRKAIQLL